MQSLPFVQLVLALGSSCSCTAFTLAYALEFACACAPSYFFAFSHSHASCSLPTLSYTPFTRFLLSARSYPHLTSSTCLEMTGRYADSGRCNRPDRPEEQPVYFDANSVELQQRRIARPKSAKGANSVGLSSAAGPSEPSFGTAGQFGMASSQQQPTQPAIAPTTSQPSTFQPPTLPTTSSATPMTAPNTTPTAPSTASSSASSQPSTVPQPAGGSAAPPQPSAASQQGSGAGPSLEDDIDQLINEAQLRLQHHHIQVLVRLPLIEQAQYFSWKLVVVSTASTLSRMARRCLVSLTVLSRMLSGK